MIVLTAAVLKFTPRVLRDARINAGSVEACCEVRAEANKASFQEKAKTMIAVTISPSNDRGRAIIQKICQRLAPSILAASSTSLLTSRKMSRMMTTQNAKLNVEYRRMRPDQVSIRRNC